MPSSYDRPSTPRGAASLPQKPKSSSTASARKKVHRKRSVSPVAVSGEDDDDDEVEAVSNPAKKVKTAAEGGSKAGAGGSLLSKALNGATREAQQAKEKAKEQPETPNVKAQFEEQSDFISFDLSPPPPPSRTRTPRFTPGASGSKRKLDEYEERDAEGSRRMQKREKERSTPWCEEGEGGGVQWDKAENAVSM